MTTLDVHAVVDHPFAAVGGALGKPENWCDLMNLHQNIKYCRRTAEAGVPQIELRVGKKFDQPIAAASKVAFAFRTLNASPDYLAVEHLATIAHDKVGFTSASKPGEPPDYIGGMRGLVERNTMRYYLAIDAYLDALAAPAAERMEKRFRDWFDATEKYPRQLHEMGRDAYLAMKRRPSAQRWPNTLIHVKACCGASAILSVGFKKISAGFHKFFLGESYEQDSFIVEPGARPSAGRECFRR